MTEQDQTDKQAVGAGFTLDGMRAARERTFEAVRRVAAAVQPGMTEAGAKTAARRVLEQMGMDRTWHQILVRFGSSTLKTFDQKMSADNVLGSDDLFFVDLGVVWNGHEGDAGDTFVVGRPDDDMRRCAEDVRALWQDVSDRWRREGASGTELYRFAAERAGEMGWVLNQQVRGHRLSDFPHSVHHGGDLGDFADTPESGRWVLEIQIAHPDKPFGAFYEDLLLND